MQSYCDLCGMNGTRYQVDSGMNNFPPLLDMIRGLISTPSVSSVDPARDQGNRAVIELLANWLEAQRFPGRNHAIAWRQSRKPT